MTDRYFTPDQAANEILGVVAIEEPRLAADFSAGEGALLSAIHAKWPDCRLVANDVDIKSVSFLSKRFAQITIAKADFLNTRSRRSSKLRAFLGIVDLIFINPPFSCRGSRTTPVIFAGKLFRASPALAFIAYSEAYLSPDGMIIALLPASCLYSEKDVALLTELKASFSIEIVGEASPWLFRGCRVNVKYVTFTKQKNVELENSDALPYGIPINQYNTEISGLLTRGSLSVASAKKLLDDDGLPYIHTTDLKYELSTLPKRRVRVDRSLLTRSAILIPRVGPVRFGKVCIYRGPFPVALSDCVIAIIPYQESDVQSLYLRLQQNWISIADHYVGTCARYITLSCLKFAFESIQIALDVRHLKECSTTGSL